MRKSSFWLVVTILAFATSAVAQDHYSCNTQRYRLDVFENIKVTNEIKFGEETTLAGNNQELFMDIYEPADDDVTERPVIVLAFGGSFIGGSRRDMKPLCERFASRGYVVASIDYRLYDLPLVPFPTEEEMQDVVIRAIKDMKSALRYLDNDAKSSDTFGIDMNWLYVGGISSGGITANHAAMLDSTDVYSEAIASAISTHSPIFGITDSDTSIKIRGVLNYSGALYDASWLDESDPPFISFHEDEDPTVPYKGGYAQIFGQDIIYLNGSYVMDSSAKANGVISELNTINSNTHVGYFLNPEKTTEIVDKSAFFMYEMICSETAGTEEVLEDKPYSLGPNPSFGQIVLRVDATSTIEILDISGRIVETVKNVQAGEITLPRLANGTYILKIQTGNQLYTERVVKN